MIELLHGDCLELMRAMPANSVDLIATDPPYFKVKGDAWDNQWATPAAFLAWFDLLAEQWQRILRPNGSLYVFAWQKMAEADDARPSQRVEAIRRRDHADDKLAWAIASGGAVVLRRTGECTCSDEQATESSKKISVQWAVADWFKTECAARRRAS